MRNLNRRGRHEKRQGPTNMHLSLMSDSLKTLKSVRQRLGHSDYDVPTTDEMRQISREVTDMTQRLSGFMAPARAHALDDMARGQLYGALPTAARRQIYNRTQRRCSRNTVRTIPVSRTPVSLSSLREEATNLLEGAQQKQEELEARRRAVSRQSSSGTDETTGADSIGSNRHEANIQSFPHHNSTSRMRDAGTASLLPFLSNLYQDEVSGSGRSSASKTGMPLHVIASIEGFEIPSVVAHPLRPASYSSGYGRRSCEDNTCSICLETMEAGQRALTLVCGHSFHEACIKQWLVRSFYCCLCHRFL